jgi:iron complex outermembrane receptor protein
MNRLLLLLAIALLWAQEEGRKRQVQGEGKESQPPASGPTVLRLEGVVRDATTGEALPGAYIKVKGTLAGVVSGPEGRFQLSIPGGSLPITLEASYVGYENTEITTNSPTVEIKLQESNLTLREVVISTSRVPETVLEAPVTVSRMGIRELRLNAGANLIQQLATLKNVDVNYQSITFPVINTRGFGQSGNPRFVQRIDGIDMLAPVFGFPVGILSTPPEIDVETVELTAGPASAMYGPNAFNGMMDMYTRTPRRYPGLSATLKGGVNHIASDTTPQPYFNFALRYAQTIGDRFSFKLVGEYLRATDWLAVDDRDQGPYTGAEGIYAIPGPQNPGYNAVNRYGDEVRILIDPTQVGLPLREKFYVARTGYRDRDLIDPAVFLQKYTASAQYFLTDKIELSWRSFAVNGNTIYQAANRNVLRDVLFHQHKIELRTPALLFRTYGSWENSGRAYDSRFTGIFLNQWAKPNDVWFLAYLEGYALYGTHEAARVYADTAMRLQSLPPSSTFRRRLEPGTPEFKEVFNQINSRYYRTQGGAGFYDRSSFYHSELQYDFSKYTSRIADLLIGGNLRLYHIKTNGTLFVDYGGPFWVHEYGGFLQANRWLWNRRVRLLGSIRYDKSQYMPGRFTPRLATLFLWGKERQNSIRLSYQTGFRLPTLQDQFIALDIGFNEITLGGTSRARSAYGLDRWAYTPQSVSAYRSAAQNVSPNDSATLASLAQQYLVKVPLEFVRPEYIQNYEIGTRFLLLKGLYLDVEYARAYYTDFILYRRVVSSKPSYEAGTTKPIALSNLNPNTLEGLQNLRAGNTYEYSTATNLRDQVYADYASVGIEYAITPKVLWTLSYSYASLTLSTAKDPSLLPNFNAPRHKVGSSLYFFNLGRWSASLNYRWIDATKFDGLITGQVPAVQWVDAQVGYLIPRYKLQIRLGGQNLLNIRYVQIPGGPRIGGLYYLQLTYDPALVK